MQSFSFARYFAYCGSVGLLLHNSQHNFFPCICNMEEFKLSVQLADKMTKGKIRLLKKIGA